MSNIDNIRLKAANAGSKPVGITGAELLSVMNYIAEQGNAGLGTVTSVGTVAPLSGTVTTSGSLTTSMATNKLIGRGTAGTGVMEEITLGTGLSFTGTILNAATGLATTGATTGATAFNQEFSKGVTVGAASSENGVLNFFNSTGATQVVVSSTAAKQVSIRNTGDDVEASINGAAVAGIALNVVGSAKVTSLLVGDGSSQITQPAADQLLLTAADGVTFTGGITGKAPVVKTVDYDLTPSDFSIQIDTSSNPVVIGNNGANDGQIFIIRKNTAAEPATISGVNGGTYTLVTQGDSVIIQRDVAQGQFNVVAEYKQ